MAEIDDVLAQYSNRQAFEDDEARQTLEAMRGPTQTRAKVGDTVDRGYILPYARSVQEPYKGPWNNASTSDILKHLDVNPDGKTADRWAVPGILKDIWDSATTVGGSASLENKPYLRPSQMSEEDIEQYLATAGAGTSAAILGGLGRLGLGPRTPGGELGTFGGRLAKTADHEALARAEAKAAQGVPREQIWADEGWFQGPDGKWRFEIDDSGAKFAQPLEQFYKRERDTYGIPSPEAPLSNILDHSALYEAYPSLKYGRVEVGDQSGGSVTSRSTGSYRGRDMDGYDLFGVTPDANKQTVMHEIQHALADREGTAQGGSPRNFGQQKDAELARDALSFRRELDRHPTSMDRHARENAVIDEYKNIDAMDMLPSREARDLAHDIHNNPSAQLDELVKLYGLDRKTTPSSDMQLYKSLAGEAESRLVEKRMDMTPEERRSRPPWLDYDVPEKDQIVRFGNSGPSASVDDTLRQYSKPEPEGFTVYHGSPHDFDRFDLSKIGTGEGAQAYGHGLYFAENEGVAKAYQETLGAIKGPAFENPTFKGGGSLGSYDMAMRMAGNDGAADAARALREYMLERPVHDKLRFDGGTIDDAIGSLKERLQSQKEQSGPQYASYYDDVIKGLERVRSDIDPKDYRAGHMYEARIKANPEDFLDWDKPLSQQGKNVQDALRGIYNDADTGEHIARTAAADARDVAIMRGDNANTTLDRSQQRASEGLRDLGIPGIRYLDQGSRGAGEGSRNYVVFDDKLIQMVRKYGWAAAMAMAAASAQGTGSAEAGSIDDVLSQYSVPTKAEGGAVSGHDDEEVRQTLEAMYGPQPRKAVAGDTVDRGYILPWVRTMGNDGKTEDSWGMPGIVKDVVDAAKTVSGSASLKNEPYLRPSQMTQGEIDSYLATAGAGTSAALLGGLGRAAIGPRSSELGSGGSKMVQPSLPMDEASRLARAREMGFDTDKTWYHGTNSAFDEFGRVDGGNALGAGHYFTESPQRASDYALGQGVNRMTPSGAAGPSVLPTRLKMEKPFSDRDVLSMKDLKAVESALRADPEIGSHWKKGEFVKSFDRAYKPTGANVAQSISYNPDEANRVLRAAGYDSRLTGDVVNGSLVPGQRTAVVFEPNQVRSVNAEFDPSKASSGKLLAAHPAAAALAPFLTGNEEGIEDILARYNRPRGDFE